MTDSATLAAASILTLGLFAWWCVMFARKHGEWDADLIIPRLRFDEFLRLRMLIWTVVLLFLGAVMTWRP